MKRRRFSIVLGVLCVQRFNLSIGCRQRGAAALLANPRVRIVTAKEKSRSEIRCGRVGGTRLELVTSTMSTWRSNQLS